ncbi:MAG: secretin N-terminal domain-containing protein [Steroidobacter sp.]
MSIRNVCIIAVIVAFGLEPAVSAESTTVKSDTVPIATVLSAVAERTGKKFIVDPRVQGDVLLRENPASLSYDDFLVLMQVHGFAAVTNGQYVRVVPEAVVRQLALPTATDDKHPLAEYVNRIVPVKSVPAAMLVPLLRPLIPQQGHLVALPCTNDLLIVDTFGNIQRLEKLIKSLDRGEPYAPTKCTISATEKRGDA